MIRNKMMLLVDKSIAFETAAFLMASVSHGSDKMVAAAECIGKIFWMADDLCDFVDVVKNRRRNRLQLHALAYNLFNWFRRLALAARMRKLRIDAVRLKLLKIAARVVRSARYTTF